MIQFVEMYLRSIAALRCRATGNFRRNLHPTLPARKKPGGRAARFCTPEANQNFPPPPPWLAPEEEVWVLLPPPERLSWGLAVLVTLL